jgi:hypothetical protein
MAFNARAFAAVVVDVAIQQAGMKVSYVEAIVMVRCVHLRSFTGTRRTRDALVMDVKVLTTSCGVQRQQTTTKT